jgi:hypothetical protein
MVVALGALFLYLANPTHVSEVSEEIPGRTILLVDGSGSISAVPGRLAQVQEAIAANRGQNVDIFHFGSDLHAGEPESYALDSTDIGAALGAISSRIAGAPLDSVVLISDGVDLGPMARAFATGQALSVAKLSGPLTVIGVGETSQAAEISLTQMTTSSYAYLRTPFPIEFQVASQGYAGRSVQVALERDNQPVKTTTVQIDDQGNGIGTFEVRPTRAGRFAYRVSLPTFSDDRVVTNNALTRVVTVVRDRIRVLQVAGAPSWDVKVMRRFLKEDPSVDLVSFFILRTLEDMESGYNPDELSLIPFPFERLFSEELETFDVVMFQNFDYRPYFGIRGDEGMGLLDNVARYVTEGGHGFVMVGGDRSFDLGEYQDTPIGDILPFQLGLVGQKVSEPPFLPKLTEAGMNHPMTRLSFDPARNEEAWTSLHPVDGANRVVGMAPTAVSLLEHPSETDTTGAPLPVLGVMEAGEGRVMGLTIDGSWRWGLSEAAKGRGTETFGKFWKGAFRWLMGDPSSARVVVETAKENVRLGQAVRVVVRAKSVSFAPAAGVEVKVTVEGPRDKQVQQLVTDELGEAVLVVSAETTGVHRITAVVSEAGTMSEATTLFAVTDRDPERSAENPNHDLLREIANSYGGVFSDDVRVERVRDSSATKRIKRQERVELARKPWVGAIFLFSFGTVWLIRRRIGLR